ncbi:MAG: hypothetical protein ACYTEQ_22855 [Planctomycetota bacterium]|jgi:hypothetical protein
MEEREHFGAYLKALWETPIAFILILLDIVGIWPVATILIDDWGEGAVLALFLVVWFVAHYLIFRRLRVDIAKRDAQIAELEATEADIHISLLKEPELGLQGGALDERGLPSRGAIQVTLEFRNIGYEPGEPVLIVDPSESRLPRGIAFDPERDPGYNWALHRIEGRDDTQAYYTIPVRVTSRDSIQLARELNSRESYRVVLKYHTKRIGGTSPQHELIIKGDLRLTRQHMRNYWLKHGFDHLAELVDVDKG